MLFLRDDYGAVGDTRCIALILRGTVDGGVEFWSIYPVYMKYIAFGFWLLALGAGVFRVFLLLCRALPFDWLGVVGRVEGDVFACFSCFSFGGLGFRFM